MMYIMTTARAKLVDSTTPLYYHLVSRCVRESWLCGVDTRTGKDYSHRKAWLVKRIKQLAQYYAVEVMAYTVMSNHFHLVVYYDPLACLTWSDEEVIRRWTQAHPIMRNGTPDATANAVRSSMLLAQPERVQRLREHLGSLSTFMQHLKQPIAWRANREDKCRGHFFESRFYSGALLSDESVIAAMAYVDLNPMRARIVHSIKQCANTSITERLHVLENSPERLEVAISPIVSGIETTCTVSSDAALQTQSSSSIKPSRPNISNKAYVALLESIVDAERNPSDLQNDEVKAWVTRVAEHRKRKPAFGSPRELIPWLKQRGFRLPKKF